MFVCRYVGFELTVDMAKAFQAVVLARRVDCNVIALDTHF